MRSIIYPSQLDERGAELAKESQPEPAPASPVEGDPDDILKKAIEAAKAGNLSDDLRGVLIAHGYSPEAMLSKSGPVCLPGFESRGQAVSEELRKAKAVISESQIVKALDRIERVVLRK